MTGREITAQAIADMREAVREQNRLARMSIPDALERARQAVYARAASGAKPVLPLALRTALAADALPTGGLRTGSRTGTVTPPEAKTPERAALRGKTTALGVLIRGTVTLNGPVAASRAQMMDPDYWSEQREKEGGEG